MCSAGPLTRQAGCGRSHPIASCPLRATDRIAIVRETGVGLGSVNPNGRARGIFSKICGHVFGKPAGEEKTRMNVPPKINRLLEEHEPFVKAMACRLAPLPQLAEDIAQQVFLEFLNKADQWDLSRDLKPLLAVMTRKVALRHWSERTRLMSLEMRELSDHIQELAEDCDLEWYGPEERTALQQCIEALPEKSRQLIKLHYYLDVSSVEIARQMQINADAVRRALFRMRQRLRKCIEATLKPI